MTSKDSPPKCTTTTCELRIHEPYKLSTFIQYIRSLSINETWCSVEGPGTNNGNKLIITIGQ